MPKKKTGRNQVSKGQRNNVAKSAIKAGRKEYLATPGLRLQNQMKALKKKRRVVFTVKNPNEHETNKQFIKVAISGEGKSV